MTSVLTSVGELRALVAGWRARGERVALAPTMSALHAGHRSLVTLGRARADRVIASVFVNPTQFAPHEDFARYPRAFDADLALLQGAGADAVFHPSTQAIYPEGFSTRVAPAGPAQVGLEDAFRPTHFKGVATVVVKLLMLAQPDVAIFGEKDYQQLVVVRRVVADLDMPVSIEGALIVREPDGLAMSSRNIYLDARERALAPMLHAVLRGLAQDFSEPALAAARARLERAGFALEYLERRDALTLEAPRAGEPQRLLVAARLGRTRLIDNVAMESAP